MPRPATIAALRRQIDRLDDRVLELLNQRARLAQAVGATKTRTRATVYAPAREKHVLARLVSANRGPLANRHVPMLATRILRISAEGFMTAGEIPKSAIAARYPDAPACPTEE